MERVDKYRKYYSTKVDHMVTNDKKNNIKITLPLIALCVPLFANHSVTIENSCPYETYVRVDGKCLDISQEGLEEITAELNSNSVKEISKEVEDLSEELEDLSEELDELCLSEQPETASQIEIMEDVCQY